MTDGAQDFRAAAFGDSLTIRNGEAATQNTAGEYLKIL